MSETDGLVAESADMATRLLPKDVSNMRWTLISIPFSHFNERARWALDLARIPYRRVDVLPMLHVPVVAWHQRAVRHRRRADRVSSPFSTPLLIGTSARATGAAAPIEPIVLNESGDILSFVDALDSALTLYPADVAAEIKAVERVCHDVIGPAARVIDYHYLLPSWVGMARMAFKNVGVIQATLFSVLFPLVRLALRTSMRINADRAEASLAKVREAFDDISHRLQANATK